MKTTPFVNSPRLAALALASVLALSGCNKETAPSLIDSGRQFDAKKNYPAAIIKYKAALQIDSNSPEVRLLLGKAMLATGDPASAALELTKALDQNVTADKVWPALSDALFRIGEYKKLTTLSAEAVIADKTAQAALNTNVAKAWGAQGDKAKAQALVAQVLAAIPGYGPALIVSASLMAGRAEYSQAVAVLDQVLARDDSLHEGWMLKGELLLATSKDKPGARAAFRKVVALEPTYLPAHAALISGFLGDEDVASAKQQAAQLRAALPNHPQTLFVDALIAYNEKDLPKSRELVQQVLRQVPDSPVVLHLAGVIEGRLGALALAENYLSKALTINPGLEAARVNLARVYMALGQPGKAMDVLRPALAADIGSGSAHATAGEALLQMGDSAAAEVQFVRAAKLNPDDVKTRTALALSRLTSADADAAFAELASLATQSKDTYPDLSLISARLARFEYPAALTAVDALSKKEPNNAKHSELRGKVLLALKDNVGARAAFEQALKLDPALFSATLNLAELDVLEKKPEQAQKRVQASIAADPSNYFARLSLANLRARRDAPLDELRSIYSDAIKSAPTAVEPRLSWLELLLRKRQVKEALVVAGEAAASFPNDATVIEALGKTQMEAGDPERAVKSFRSLASLLPGSPMPYVRLAAVYRAWDRREATETALKKALEIDPIYIPAQQGLADHLMTGNRAKEALTFAQDLQQKYPAHAGGYAVEAAIRLRSKSPDAAMAILRQGLARAKPATDLAKQLFTNQVGMGQVAEANRFAAEWLKKHPEDWALDLEVGSVASARGEYERAETHLVRVLQKQPNVPAVLNNLAWLWIQLGKPGALALAERAVDLAPDQPAFLDTLALALVADKRPAEALVQQKKAVELAPADNHLHLSLAQIALQAGDKTLARTELERLRGLGAAFAKQDKVTALMKSL
jgi:cellulose synthase operon protein C